MSTPQPSPAASAEDTAPADPVETNDPGDLLTVPWYPVVDDTIGGAALSNVNKPVSGLDFRTGEVTVAHFMTLDHAEYIATLHNRQLAAQITS